MTRTGNILSGSAYPWTVEIQGDNLVVTGQHATWFGGSNDPQDDGSTASGMSTKRNPSILGCALPMDFNRPHDNPCAGSPLPKLPWFTTILVKSNGLKLLVKLIDLGPAAPPKASAAIDLTQAAFIALGGDIRTGRIPVDFEVIGGAKLLGLTETVTSSDDKTDQDQIPASQPGLVVTPEFGLPIV